MSPEIFGGAAAWEERDEVERKEMGSRSRFGGECVNEASRRVEVSQTTSESLSS